MKFFYINNTLCTDCGRCSESCPTGAISFNDGKRYINPDKCTACGSCIRSCDAGAVSVETLEHMAAEMERTETYRNRIRRLEKELATLKERTDTLASCFDQLVMRLPIATFICSRGGKIAVANKVLPQLAGIAPLRLSDLPDNLAGENIFTLLPEEMSQMIRMSASADSERCYITELGGHPVSISLSPLAGEYVLGMIRDLREPNIATEQIQSLLQDAVERKMAMVQKIGSLLGEEASVEIDDLNTVIRILDSAEQKPENKA